MEQTKEVKKVIIPVAGMGTRFIPLSRAVPKDFFPLVDKPVIQYIIEEVKKSGIKEIIFVQSPGQKNIQNYFKKDPDLEKFLIKRKRDNALKELKDLEEMFAGITFSYAVQKEPLGDGHALLQAASKTKGEAVAVSFGDDVVYSDEPAIAQLVNVFKTCSAIN